jgi:PAS domain S-box-containing protein
MTKDIKSYNILVIEDNPGDFILISDYLEEQFATVQIDHANNFNEARTKISLHDSNFDVILLDLSLPDKSGESLIAEMSILCRRCPVIILTGFADIEFSIKSLSQGIADYLLKDDINAFSLYKSIIYNIERKKTNLELEESEKRYSDIFHLSPQPMWIYEVESLAFLDVNTAAVASYGYSRDEFLAMTLNEILSTNHLVDTKETEFFYSGRTDGSSQGIYSYRKKSGDMIQVNVQSNVITHKGKKVKLILAIDITERLNYIRTIEMQNSKLQEIAWIQSHLVRAPLAKMMGLIDVIKNHSVSDMEKTELLVHVLDSAHEFDVLIKDIVGRTEDLQINLNEHEI